MCLDECHSFVHTFIHGCRVEVAGRGGHVCVLQGLQALLALHPGVAWPSRAHSFMSILVTNSQEV